MQPARTDGGNRRYSDYDIEILRRISELADEGMNLEGIRRVMQLEAELEAARRELEDMREQVRELAAHVEQNQRADLVPLRQAITLFGAGDPKMMAGGISEALVTTMLGLTTAIPLVLLHATVANSAKRVIDVLDEQSAGLIALRSERASAGG